MGMDLPKIRTFLTAADCLSFSETAVQLHTTQPNVSKQISFLEQDLGVQLFEREKSHIRLTPAGEILRQEYGKAFDHVEQGRILAQQRARGKEMCFYLGIFEGYGPERHVSSLVNMLERTYPNVEVIVEWNGLPQLQAGINGGTLDMCLCKHFDASSMRKCNQFVLGTGTPMMYLSADHPLASRDTLNLAEMGGVPLVTIQPKIAAAGYTYQMDTLKAAGYNPTKVYLVSNILSQVNYVLMGRGFGIGDKNYRFFHLRALRGYPLKNFPAGKDVLVWREDNTNPAVPLCIDCAERITSTGSSCDSEI